jgi:hypothetical protein
MSIIIDLKERKSDTYGQWAEALAGRTADGLDTAPGQSMNPVREQDYQREVVRARRAWANYLPFWDDTSASKYSRTAASNSQPEDCQYSI